MSSFARLLFPDERQRLYLKALLRPPAHLVVKDPLATMTAEHLITRFGFKVVFTVKHPFAFYDSLLRVGWHATLPVADLKAQSPGIFDAGSDPTGKTWPAQAAAVWTVINAHALGLVRRYPENALIVRHEDLCNHPDRELTAVCAFLGMRYGKEMQDYVRATTSGSEVTPDSSVIFSFDRKAAALPDRWRGRLSEEDCCALREGTQAIAAVLYPESPAEPATSALPVPTAGPMTLSKDLVEERR